MTAVVDLLHDARANCHNLHSSIVGIVNISTDDQFEELELRQVCSFDGRIENDQNAQIFEESDVHGRKLVSVTKIKVLAVYHVPPVNVFDAAVIGMLDELYFRPVFANEAVSANQVCSSKADIFCSQKRRCVLSSSRCLELKSNNKRVWCLNVFLLHKHLPKHLNHHTNIGPDLLRLVSHHLLQ